MKKPSESLCQVVFGLAVSVSSLLFGARERQKNREASVRLGHKSLRTLMKRSSCWYLPGDNLTSASGRFIKAISQASCPFFYFLIFTFLFLFLTQTQPYKELKSMLGLGPGIIRNRKRNKNEKESKKERQREMK